MRRSAPCAVLSVRITAAPIADYRQNPGVAAMMEQGKITLNYVAPDARFRGVSKALLACLEKRLKALGIAQCSLESTQTALRFYEAMGYVASKESYDLPLTGVPATVLVKRLSDA